MKTASTPMEIWHNEPSLRAFLKRSHIIEEDADGKISIPAFKCNIEKPIEWGRGNKSEVRQYAFYHQKMQFMLDSMNGDYVRACDSLNNNNRSFLCGKNMDITVTLL